MTLVNPLDVHKVVRPRTVAEALAYLDEGDVQVAPLAGGMSLLADRTAGAEVLLDLSEMGWRYVRLTEEELHIGATTPVEDVIATQALTEWAQGVLVTAARAVAPQVQRYQITLGGVLMAPDRGSDLVAALMALDAQVVYYTPANRDHPVRTPVATFVRPAGEANRRLVAAVLVPGTTRTWRASLHRLGRTPRDQALVCVVAAAGQTSSGRTVRLVVGGVGIIPQRLSSLESLVAAAEDAPSLLAEVEKRARESVTVPEDWRASADYRRAVAGVLVRRAVADVLG